MTRQRQQQRRRRARAKQGKRHPFYASPHYQEFLRIHQQRLRELGFSPAERAALMRATRQDLDRWLSTGELVYEPLTAQLFARKGWVNS